MGYLPGKVLLGMGVEERGLLKRKLRLGDPSTLLREEVWALVSSHPGLRVWSWTLVNPPGEATLSRPQLCVAQSRSTIRAALGKQRTKEPTQRMETGE